MYKNLKITYMYTQCKNNLYDAGFVFCHCLHIFSLNAHSFFTIYPVHLLSTINLSSCGHGCCCSDSYTIFVSFQSLHCLWNTGGSLFDSSFCTREFFKKIYKINYTIPTTLCIGCWRVLWPFQLPLLSHTLTKESANRYQIRSARHYYVSMFPRQM